MFDKIFISELKVQCIVGAFEYEMHAKRELLIDIILLYPLKTAGLSDNLQDTLNYATLQNEIISGLSEKKFNLIECVAQHIADICLQYEKVVTVTIKITKPGATPFTKGIGIEITRNRAE